MELVIVDESFIDFCGRSGSEPLALRLPFFQLAAVRT